MVSLNRMSCAARSCEERMHAVSKFRRAITMKMRIESRRASNTEPRLKRLRAASKIKELVR